MGVLNVTPDSFSDGGSYLALTDAVAHARLMLAEGAAIVDVGGESTRPGAPRTPADEELRRVIPVVRALAAESVCLSIDTTRAEVAHAAIDAGASIVNDVSGGLADPDMAAVVAASGADFVVMHWRDHATRMSAMAQYDDVVAEVLAELLAQRDAALLAGVPGERIILDPGLGFAKTWEHNWALLRSLDRFTELGHRVLLGASRKAFLGGLLGGRPAAGRDAATAAISFWAAQHGVWAVRTHEVTAQLDAIAVAQRLVQQDPR